MLLLGSAAFTGCALVDEDVRDCYTYSSLDYELRLVTNITTEINTQLTLESELKVARVLKDTLSKVFTDFAKDVDLSFYDVMADSLRLHHESIEMETNQYSYTLKIPVRNYMHTALANVDTTMMKVADADKCHKARIVRDVADTIPSLRSGIFSARLPMVMRDDVDQEFNVNLYMVNCASAIVVDTTGSGIRDLKVFMNGFATEFSVCDSLYRFPYSPVVRPVKLQLEDPGLMCFVAVSFPSRDIPQPKSTVDTDDPFVSESADHSLWQMRAYATLQNGTITETVLGISQPLRPGQLKLVKAKAFDNGRVSPGDPSVSVSVTLDWSPGVSGEIVL